MYARATWHHWSGEGHRHYHHHRYHNDNKNFTICKFKIKTANDYFAFITQAGVCSTCVEKVAGRVVGNLHSGFCFDYSANEEGIEPFENTIKDGGKTAL